MNDLQRTPEWFKEREGKLTASAFGQAAGLGPGSRQQLWRRMAGLEPPFEGNPATEWGTAMEPVAIEAYTQITGASVELVGFVKHSEFDWLGGSPDLLIGEFGVGEVKCPFSQELYDEVPPYYMAQVQGVLEIADRAWCDFICWTPARMSVTRIARSQTYWDWLHLRLADFWIYVQAAAEPPRAKKLAPPDISTSIIYTKIFDLQGTDA